MRSSIEIIARGLLRHGGFVLVCRNLSSGYFYLPGGHVEVGETAQRACEREFMEESGMSVRASKLLVAADVAFRTHTWLVQELSLVFHVELDGPSRDITSSPPTVTSEEAAIAFEWLDLQGVKTADLRPSCIRDWIIACEPHTSSAASAYLVQHCQ